MWPALSCNDFFYHLGSNTWIYKFIIFIKVSLVNSLKCLLIYDRVKFINEDIVVYGTLPIKQWNTILLLLQCFHVKVKL
jgi:hypothetical protein